MSVSTHPRQVVAGAEFRSGMLRACLVLFAAYHLALAIMMATAPHAFFTSLGPFGARNDHYVRDLATYNAALGVGFAIAVHRASWRVPVLGLTALQFALHSVNHLIDIGKAHPAWTGYFDFFSLALTTALLAWLLSIAVARARTIPTPTEGGHR